MSLMVSVLKAPDEEQQWWSKVERAMQARETGKVLREGKSPVAPLSWAPHLTGS